MAAVLAKVQKEYGSSVKIVKAQKVRSGGVMGFFAREKFEVIVEENPAAAAPAPAPAAPATPPAAAAPPTSLEDLVGQINESERAIAPPPQIPSAMTPPPAVPPTAAAAPAAPVTPEPTPVVDVTPPTLPVEPTTDPVVAPAPIAATPPAPPTPPRVEPIKAEPIKAEPVVSEPVTPPVSAAPSAPVEPVVPAVQPPVNPPMKPIDHTEQPPRPRISTESDTFAEVLSRMAYQADMQSEPKPATQPAPEPVIDSDVKQDEGAGDQQLETGTGAKDSGDQSEPAMTNNTSIVDVRPPVPVVVQRTSDGIAIPAERTRKSDSPLAHLGLPVQFIPERIDLTDVVKLRYSLTAALQGLPQPPAIRPSRGAVIAVVGNREDALILAEELADHFGRPRDEVVLASANYHVGEYTGQRLIRSVQDAGDAQRAWQRRDRVTIVAIEASLGGRATVWAEHVLTALEPIATYGVTDATRKSEDIAAWASALGGIDCLAINHIQETVSPAAVLATGIPVDRLDGRQASPAYWAMLLSERLTAA